MSKIMIKRTASERIVSADFQSLACDSPVLAIC
ncbi:MAG: hypothetical protein ACI8T1_000885 [Verrucomicrobiales bacterium]|jgi:hypothetical protein